MRCPPCSEETTAGKRFCMNCGNPLEDRCQSCDAELPSGARFCADCGAPASSAALAALAAPRTEPAASPVATSTELRHVSVLFCDLVGFTPLAESRDPADVRELLSGYFEAARSTVQRYGGVVEKYIGDAVMAVWGAPTANEDDAERAVRAGLDLIQAVRALGAEVGLSLDARVGIVTGRAATPTAGAESLVVGDRVNTAARIQAAAPPGGCYVDETTRRRRRGPSPTSIADRTSSRERPVRSASTRRSGSWPRSPGHSARSASKRPSPAATTRCGS